MAGLTLEQLNKIGAKPKQIGGVPLQQLQKPEPTFSERIKEDLAKRRETFGAGVEAQSRQQQTTTETTLQAVGQGAGLLFDVAGEALKSVVDKIPDAIKKPIVAKSVLNTPLGEAGIKAISQGMDIYKEWKVGNPRAARDLESVVNIGLLIPFGVGAKVAERGVAKPLIEKALVESGEKALIKTQGEFIRELVRPIATVTTKKEFVTRTTEIGVGPFKRSVITPTSQERIAENFVSQIPKVKPANTFQRNYNFIKDANFTEAERLKTLLINNDFVFTKKELLLKLRNTKSKLAENPLITGDAKKAAGKLITKIQTMVAKKPAKGKGSELLQIRKDFDRWVGSQRGEAIFDPAKESAISISNREIRRTINDFLNVNAKNVGVKDSLKKQSSLFNAMENIAPKAAQEADTAFIRSLQRVGNVLGTKSRIVQGIAAAVGIGGLGAAATFAPAAAAMGISGWLIYQGGKLILKPQVRILLGKAVGELQRNAGLLTRVSGIGVIGALKDNNDAINELKQLLEKYD